MVTAKFRYSSLATSVYDVLRHFFFIFNEGEAGQCLSSKSYRSAPGGSGAGGSVVIITNTLHGSPNGKIFILGGGRVNCAYGTGGGEVTSF